MKRYALFICEQSAANGGWDDFEDSFDDLEAAKQEGLNWAKKDKNIAVIYWHVVDLDKGNVAARGACYPFDNEPAENFDDFDDLDPEDED